MKLYLTTFPNDELLLLGTDKILNFSIKLHA